MSEIETQGEIRSSLSGSVAGGDVALPVRAAKSHAVGTARAVRLAAP